MNAKVVLHHPHQHYDGNPYIFHIHRFLLHDALLLFCNDYAHGIHNTYIFCNRFLHGIQHIQHHVRNQTGNTHRV